MNSEQDKAADETNISSEAKLPKILRNRKARIERRLAPRNWCDQPQPMLRGGNVHYEMAERAGGVGCGGLGVMHTLCNRLGLVKEIDEHLHLLKVHLPYHESDHVLNLPTTYCRGVRMEDIELRRQGRGSFSTVWGRSGSGSDHRRGISPGVSVREDILTLQECINRTRERVLATAARRPSWRRRTSMWTARSLARVVNAKGGIGLSYKGVWGYHPLIGQSGQHQEVLYLINRPGNVVSHEDSVAWIDRAIALVKPHAGQVVLRGDTTSRTRRN